MDTISPTKSKTSKSVVLEGPKQISCKDITLHPLSPEEVLVKIHSAHVLSNTEPVVNGLLPFQLPYPFVLGPFGVGVIEEVGSKVSNPQIQPGQLCCLLPSFGSSKDDNATLLGWFPIGSAGSKFFADYPAGGTWAQHTIRPASHIIPLPNPKIPKDTIDFSVFNMLNFCGIAYGALTKYVNNKQPNTGLAGSTILINGASGNLGTCACLVACSLGAKRVYACGRRPIPLKELAEIDDRIIPVTTLYSEDGFKPKNIDLVVDTLGAVPSPDPSLKALFTLRPGGTFVAVGGVQANLTLPYGFLLGTEIIVRGSYMYAPEAIGFLYDLYTAGTLKLPFKGIPFGLDSIWSAIKQSQEIKTGFEFVYLQPNPTTPNSKSQI